MSRPKPKVPRTPPDRLTKEPADIVDYTGILWRVHRTTGEHVRPWNELRTFGPLPSMRWDPHPGPQPADHPDGVLYAASDVATSLAEIYQSTRVIEPRRRAEAHRVGANAAPTVAGLVRDLAAAQCSFRGTARRSAIHLPTLGPRDLRNLA